MRKWIVFLLLLSTQHACINVATTGAQMVYNHHSIRKNVTDQYITWQSFQAIQKAPKQFADCNINISTYNARVLLAGQVHSRMQKMAAEHLIKQIPEVDRVYNLLTISSPSSSLVRISDAWITAKVKAKLIVSEDVDASQVKVVTENGTVYLMGIIPHEEASAAADIASDTDGVESVVKIFSYLRITQN